MVIGHKLLEIGITGLSLAAAFLIFWTVSDADPEEKKNQMGVLSSQTIRFILFVWIAKILLNVPLFISDPLAVLAYPAGSQSFALAAIGLMLLGTVTGKRKGLDGIFYIESTEVVVLFASFFYEFIRVIRTDDPGPFYHLLGISTCILLFVLLRRRMARAAFVSLLITAWVLVMGSLSVFLPFASAFGYILQPWFLAVFLLISLTAVYVFKVKESGNDEH